MGYNLGGDRRNLFLSGCGLMDKLLLCLLLKLPVEK